jgi:hypothetical protein
MENELEARDTSARAAASTASSRQTAPASHRARPGPYAGTRQDTGIGPAASR